MTILSTLLMLSALIWISLYLFRIRPLWLAQLPSGVPPSSPDDKITVIIPARNEAGCLPALLASLQDQGAPDTEILVVDDASTDDTAACIQRAAQSDPRIRLLSCPEKPASWTGKPWALTQGAAEARGEWLVFCDADVVLQDGTLNKAVNLAIKQDLDALSLIPRMQNQHLGIAMLLSVMALARCTLFRPASPARPGIIQGAFLLVKSRAYAVIDGHNSVGSVVLEDVAIGRKLQEKGFRVMACPAQAWLATEMYPTFADAWEGLTKHVFAVLDFSLGRLSGAFLIHFLLIALPGLCLVGSALAMGSVDHPQLYSVLIASVFPSILMPAIMLHIARQEGLPGVTALLTPLSFFLFLGIVVRSLHGYRSGSIVWKDRSYDASDFGKL